jgi:hypothetical protein
MNIKTETVSSKNDVSRRIHVKKEEENRDNDDNDNNNNNDDDGTATDIDTDTAGRRSCGFQVKTKKEEDDGNNNNNNNPAEINNCNNKKNDDDDDDDDYYIDWMNGNWGWLLPISTATSTCNNNNASTYTNTNANVNANTNANANANDTAIPSATPSSSSTSISIRKRTAASRSRNTTSVNKEDTSKSKKKTRLLPPPPTSINRHATTFKREEEEEKDSVCYNNEVNNKGNGDDDDDDGYESWTEGNWCLLLPTGSSISTHAVANVERRKHQPVRVNHRCASYHTPLHDNDAPPDENNNELDTDYSDDDHDDDDGDDEPKKSRTGKNTMVYTTKQNKRWNKMFQRLVAYKKQHKSTMVPNNHTADPELGSWVHHQRSHYRNEIIPEYRLDLLNSIRFVRNVLDNRWDEMFQRLVTYKNQHDGSTSVPQTYEADIQLGTWVCWQRYNYNSNIKVISVHRIKRLESIGFVWDALELRWMKMYGRLVAYKKQHKSTQVPRTYTDGNNDTLLSVWVDTQRVANNKGTLLKERMELLNSIDFVWEAKRGPR